MSDVWKFPSGSLHGIWYTASRLQVYHSRFYGDAARSYGLAHWFVLGWRAREGHLERFRPADVENKPGALTALMVIVVVC